MASKAGAMPSIVETVLAEMQKSSKKSRFVDVLSFLDGQDDDGEI